MQPSLFVSLLVLAWYARDFSAMLRSYLQQPVDTKCHCITAHYEAVDAVGEEQLRYQCDLIPSFEVGERALNARNARAKL